MALDPTALQSAHPALTLDDRWSYVETWPFNGWCCGDLRIEANPRDPARYRVVVAATGNEVFSSGIPPSDLGLDFETEFGLRCDWEIPSAGLEGWLATVQTDADAAYERRAVELQEARAARVGRTAAELRAEVPEAPDWLVPGILHRRWSHKVGGREKQAGKGTLVAYLLGKLERGEASVFGEAAAVASGVVLTEEPPESIREKLDAFGLERSRVIYGWEFAGLAWPEKVVALVTAAVEDGHEVVFVDNLSRSAGIEEESGTELGQAVAVLADACARAGLTLIVDHHHRKARGNIADLSRGGTALPGAVDVNIEVQRLGTSRKRRLTAIGRTRATNWVRVIELAEDGTEYAEVDDPGDLSEDDRADANAAKQEAQLVVDRLALDRPMTLAEFHGKAGGGKAESTSRRRLKALVNAGWATVMPGHRNEAGRQVPNVWTPVPASTATVTRGLEPVVAAPAGSKEPA